MAKSHLCLVGSRPQINWYGNMGYGLDLEKQSITCLGKRESREVCCGGDVYKNWLIYPQGSSFQTRMPQTIL